MDANPSRCRTKHPVMPPFILKRAPIGSNLEDYSVLEDGVVVGRIFLSPGAPQERPWMWASGHNGAYPARRSATSRRARQLWRHSRKAGAGSKPERK
jgi:hypothetical protein